ncbi:DUF5655 domain-containing protein [Clostridiaceae bacterium OttesenSCG-928-D20]|nr:DUF5655 domain-containing protein [Clostridiaceae bacterium OttesenSCG-928-D20]
MKNKSFDFFRGNSEHLSIYNELISRLNSFPKLIIKTRKSYDKMVVFCKRKNFAYISLLNEHGLFIDNGFKIIFSAPQRICDARIVVITEPHPRRFSHHVIVQTVDDIDDQLIGWLKLSCDNA